MTTKSFGDLLNDRKSAIVLSYNDLARATGLSRTALISLNKGRTNHAPPDTIKRLADVLYPDDRADGKDLFIRAGLRLDPSPDPSVTNQLQVVHVQVIETPLTKFAPKTRMYEFMVSTVVRAEAQHHFLYRYEVHLNLPGAVIIGIDRYRVEAILWQDGSEVFREEIAKAPKLRRHPIELGELRGVLEVERYPTDNTRAMLRQRLTIEGVPIFDIDPAGK